MTIKYKVIPFAGFDRHERDRLQCEFIDFNDAEQYAMSLLDICFRGTLYNVKSEYEIVGKRDGLSALVLIYKFNCEVE